MTRVCRRCTMLAATMLAGTAQAGEIAVLDETGTASAAPEIVVYGRAIDQIGVASSGSQGVVGYRDFDLRPILRTGELLETVPGMIATQHSGEGKANQYFLRGFNLDHGTDFASFVDGVPVNMRSHGHGQGYSDFNFVIPELVARIDYRKGPYYADVGDFSAAGTAQISTKTELDRPFAALTGGQYGYYRAVAAGSTKFGDGTLLVGGSAAFDNGPWVLDAALRQYSGLAKYTYGSGDRQWSVQAGGYTARWNSTDQVPQRAVDSGFIGRFGNIDPDLGGETSRLWVSGKATLGSTRLSAFAVDYKFRLTSNFTYFLDDLVDGDEFRQVDRRQLYGGAVAHDWEMSIAAMPLRLTLGGDTRYDDIGTVGLYHSVDGEVRSTVRQDRVREFSIGGYGEAALSLTPRLRAVLGLRADHYGYDVASSIVANSSGGTATMVSPKATLAWRAADGIELYANYGEGFHSNDARGAAIHIDPNTLEPVDPVDLLVKARGAELGTRIESGRFNATLVGFYLHLDSELLFTGDGGTTEPNPASRRIGAEFTGFWRPLDTVTFDLAVAYTKSRFTGVIPGQDRIPNAVPLVVAAGASWDIGNGFTLTGRLRNFGAAPLIEDNSARSKATTLVNAGGYWTRGRLRLGIDLYNVFDAKAADITYFYASRLHGEPAGGVDDTHIHPVEPRQVRATMRVAL